MGWGVGVVVHEKPIYRRNCLKRGAWTVYRFKGGEGGGACENEGMVFLRGRVDTKMHTMVLLSYLNIIHLGKALVILC